MPYALCNDCSIVSGNIRSQRLVHHFNQLLRPTVLTPAGLGPKLGLPGGLPLVIGESSRADCPLPGEVLRCTFKLSSLVGEMHGQLMSVVATLRVILPTNLQLCGGERGWAIGRDN